MDLARDAAAFAGTAIGNNRMTATPLLGDPAAYRPHPARDGADFWPTSACVCRALTQHILPALPLVPVWECAAGDGRLARTIAMTGREVIATDLFPQSFFARIARHDFLHDDPPKVALGACAITNPPRSRLTEFIARGLQLLDCGQIGGLVLLMRLDHLQAGGRVEALNRATWEVHCNWRPIWLTGISGNPRWSSQWIVWLDAPRRAPLYLRQADLA
jgi:hypothetical protein